MSKKQEQEALVSLEKLDELTEDILKNDVDGGDVNFRQIVFSGLTQSKNPILHEKMQELLFSKEEKDLKKTIILGVFIHKEMFEPVIKYGENVINMAYIDESYDDKESFLFILDALIELSYKDKLLDFESAIPLFMQLYKIACTEKSSSTLADKLLQRILNSRVGAVKLLQNEFVEIIKDFSIELNLRVIAIDILSRAEYPKILDLIEDIMGEIAASDEAEKYLPLLDVSTLALSYYPDKKYMKKAKNIITTVQKFKLNQDNGIVKRINKRVINFQNRINSVN